MKYVVLLLCCMLFVGCGQSQYSTETDETGTGLEYDISMTSEDLDVGLIHYTVQLTNTGKEPVRIEKEKLVLTTNHKINSPEGVRPVLTKESLESFYAKVLGGNDVFFLPQNGQTQEMSGVLRLEDEFIDNPNQKKVKLDTYINYDYKTKFAHSVEFSVEGKYTINVIDPTFTQAAPVQLTAIEAGYNLNEEEMIIVTIEDRGDSSADSHVIITNPSFFLGELILAECVYYKYVGTKRTLVETETISMDQSTTSVKIACKVPESFMEQVREQKSLNSQIAGEISYRYTVGEEFTFTLPEKDQQETFG